ncbi:DNA modification methylase [Virgibacillus pantothenticus]|uniref:site-specific DNA-methyltransferase n=1 Tax=Virgibacillus pantothenticus TaxID=1473 RepID=UPI001C22DE6A|nr:site-specific DNA-methyltransferase [Virgibacillus pantothenticus]MBU8567571.1 DNA modification methylase [Virgibacillus pantothenticus]MBU8601359.1 DNA modification methylase [Virgibacillus pantothenticus]MBU8636176.1 DNA modification methylase [Virgibacillus pantothenticus]MBU8643696.1 DNA modification methylase [Virgibacillus pantothenticus]MBU8648048.1 DNA modification methylase [Virgibacillus pantothenticus]
MKIETVSIEKINPATYNPRIDLQPGDDEYEKLKRSIDEFGYIEPLVWNKQTGNLVGGHQRLKILLEQGIKEVQVSVVDLDPTKEKALNIALNKITGSWDEHKLAELLQELSDTPLGIEITGFAKDELSDLMADLPNDTEIETPVEDDNFDVDEAVENIVDPETKYGDVWKLGRHLLVCGDATKTEDINKLMGDDKADLVITDPPYNVAVTSESKELSQSGRNSIMNDDMSAVEFDSFLDGVFKNYAYLMKDTAAIYVFHGSSYQREFENAMNKNGIVVRSQCIWVKNYPSFGWSQYRWQHEPVFYAYKMGKSPVWHGDRKQTTVWRAGLPAEAPIPTTIWEVDRENVNGYVHPTQKPLDLIAIPLKNSSKRKDIAVDLFGGSGSTLMTCEQAGRECRTMELDPVFCDVIKQRFFEYTGIEPILLNA